MLRHGLLDEKRMMHLGAFIKKAMSKNGDSDKYGEGMFGAIEEEKDITPGVKSEPSKEFYNDLMSKFAEISAKEDLDKKFLPTTNMGSNISNRKGPSKWKTDPDLPEGWKWKIYRTDPARERKMLLSPDQRKFASIHSALRQLVMLEGRDVEVAIITRCLLSILTSVLSSPSPGSWSRMVGSRRVCCQRATGSNRRGPSEVSSLSRPTLSS